MYNVNMKNICPNCSESIEVLSKNGFCYNCQSAYEIGVSKKGHSPYKFSLYVFASKCVLLIFLGLSLLFVATRFEVSKSETFLALLCSYRGGNYIMPENNKGYCDFYLSGDISTSIDTGGSINNKLKIEVYDGKESIFN
jgi:hypothetical protein